jgi:fumarylacetoacetase
VGAVKQDIPVLDYLNDKKISSTNSKYLYWTVSEIIAHHTVNGCNLQCGDLLATGTISGPEPHQFSSLIELIGAGQQDRFL